jgi:hypothetical protein
MRLFLVLVLHLIKLILKQMVLGAFVAVVIRKPAAGDLHVAAHVDAPGVVAVARQQPVRADFDAPGPDVVVVVAHVP